MTNQQLAKAKLLEEAIGTLKSQINTVQIMKVDRHFTLASRNDPFGVVCAIPISDTLAGSTLEAALSDMERNLAELEKEFSEL